MKATMAGARVTAGLTQVELADAIGVNVLKVIDWEKGRKVPKLDEFDRFCAVCNCTRDDIIIPAAPAI